MKKKGISIIAGTLLGLSSSIANALLIDPSDDGVLVVHNYPSTHTACLYGTRQ